MGVILTSLKLVRVCHKKDHDMCISFLHFVVIIHNCLLENLNLYVKFYPGHQMDKFMKKYTVFKMVSTSTKNFRLA